jgi:transcriptional regulator with XRE-family HTH domain
MTVDDLIALRKSLGLTQAQMASEMGLMPRAYQNLEAGSGEIPRRHSNSAERASLRVAVSQGNPMMATADIRHEALELVAMIRGR